MFVVCADEENKCCIDNERKGGRYETKKTRNKAETCRSYGTTIAVIWDGKLQDDGKDNKNTIYQGNG